MDAFGQLRTEPLYNTRAVAQRTGVPADTFRAWERRYGVPKPARTAGNHRLYSERDVAVVRWLRDQTRGGVTVSRAIQMLQSTANEPSTIAQTGPTGPTGAPSPSSVDVLPPINSLVARLVEALARFDSHLADRIVEESIALFDVEEVCLRLLQPALYEIGDRWQRGEFGIGVEHFASAFVIRKLGSLFNLSVPDDGHGPVVAACLEGELHEVGLLLTCLFLSRRGIKVYYLGPNLPLDDLVEAIRRLCPAVVLLSASTEGAAAALRAASTEIGRRINDLGRSVFEPPVIGFGGRIFAERPDLGQQIDGVHLGVNAREAVDAVNRVLASRELPHVAV